MMTKSPGLGAKSLVFRRIKLPLRDDEAVDDGGGPLGSMMLLALPRRVPGGDAEVGDSGGVFCGRNPAIVEAKDAEP
jgi:hypothetical protein